MSAPAAAPADPAGPLRRLLLALVLVGALGLLAELLLLEHFDEPWQWTPLVLLGLTLVAGAVVAWRPTARSLRGFRLVMLLCVAAGGVGMWLHLDSNVAFEREMDPTIGGRRLAREAVFGATPLLAPGALAQLGLAGLLFTLRHPALRRSPRATTAHHPTSTA